MARYHLWFLLGALLIVLVAAAPLLIALGAGTYAASHGCVLHEGFVNPCIVGGRDVGKALYTLGVLGWFGIATIPLGVIALLTLIVVWIAVAVVRQVRARRSVV
jgi:hypothetical protein